MKLLKIIGVCILGILLLPVFLLAALIVYFCILSNIRYAPPLHQPHDHVAKIELLDTHNHSETLLYTLDDSEIPDFLEQLENVTFHRYVNDPQTHYGPVAVKITYRDGWYDILGMYFNKYCTPEGKTAVRDGWYCLADKESFFPIFSRYIKEDQIPRKMVDWEEWEIGG